MNRRPLIILLAAGGVLLLAAIVLLVVQYPGDLSTIFAGPTPTPTPLPIPEITPPPSLVDLAEEYPDLADILTDPELDSAYKEFLVAYEEGGEEAAMELARQRGLLTPDDHIRVSLVLDTEDPAPLVAQLEATGVIVVSAYRDRVNVSVPLELVEAQLETEDPGAIFAQLTELEHVIAVRLPDQRVPQGSAVDGEGVGVIGADAWHRAGFTGAGVRIGILDLGFAGYQSLLGIELPGQVTVEEFGWVEEGSVHGTACAEIIHEIAPDAELFFAWYDGTDAAFGEATDWLLDQGVTVISHSAGGFIGPRDGSEWDAQRVDDLAERGIVWVNAAGNEGSSHYRGVFTDQDGDGFHEFAPNQEILPLPNEGGIVVYLMWNDWTAVTQDYDMALFDGTIFSDPGASPVGVSEEEQSGGEGQWPVERIVATETGGETVYAAVRARSTDRPVTLDIFVWPGDLEPQYREPAYSICPPSDAVGSLTVGAANHWDDSLAYYSSQGPTTDDRLKPEISAPTAVTGESYGDSVRYDEDEGFNGTSAACPHVAGAAALVWQAFPDFGRQQVVDYLLDQSVDRGAPGPDTGHGHGRLQLPSPPSEEEPTSAPPSPTSPPVEPTEPVGGLETPAPPPTTAPLPVPTAVTYVTPAPPSPGVGLGALTVTGLVLLTGGVGCLGALLLLGGGIGMLVFRRRARRAVPRRRPPARRRAPPPRGRRVPARCPACGAAVRPGMRFCNACGRSLTGEPAAAECRHCGAALKPGTRFCSRCGRPAQ